jgi:hypothetical protein
MPDAEGATPSAGGTGARAQRLTKKENKMEKPTVAVGEVVCYIYPEGQMSQKVLRHQIPDGVELGEKVGWDCKFCSFPLRDLPRGMTGCVNGHFFDMNGTGMSTSAVLYWVERSDEQIRVDEQTAAVFHPALGLNDDDQIAFTE